MAQGYLYRNGAKALFLLFTNDNPSRCVQSRDCTHTIDGRELTNRHNSIRELLMHMCVCCCLPGWHRDTCIATVQMHSISPTHECHSKLLCSIAGLHAHNRWARTHKSSQ